MINEATQLGQMLGQLARLQNQLQYDIAPDDVSGLLYQLLLSAGNIAASAGGTIVTKLYSSTAFIIDHPIQGNIDSPLYSIDGGYSSTNTNQIF